MSLNSFEYAEVGVLSGNNLLKIDPFGLRRSGHCPRYPADVEIPLLKAIRSHCDPSQGLILDIRRFYRVGRNLALMSGAFKS
jgi:hypothetical protein